MKRNAWTKIAAAAIALILVLALAGCGQNGSGKNIKVNIEFDTSAAPDYTGLLKGAKGQVEVEEGATVFDALEKYVKDNNSGVEWSGDGASLYVTSIDTVASGANTGWVYTLNGEMVMTGCNETVLEDGDTVVWSFITW